MAFNKPLGGLKRSLRPNTKNMRLKGHRSHEYLGDLREVRFYLREREEGLRPWLVRELTCPACGEWFEAPQNPPLTCGKVKCRVPAYTRLRQDMRNTNLRNLR